MKRTRSPVFAPGFRLSLLDGCILFFGAIAAVALSTVVWWWGAVLGFVIGHFFLFCNVVRMARPLELLWTGVFIALAAATITLDLPGWPLTASISLLVTVVVVAIQMRRPSYHGIGWQRINPRLPDWWVKQTGEGPDG